MATLRRNFTLERFHNHNDLVLELSPLIRLQAGDFADINLTFKGEFIYTDHLVLFVSIINQLRENGVHIEINLDKSSASSCLKYASRVDFFPMVEIPYDGDFIRHDSDGRFTEILKFDAQTIYTIQDRVNVILYKAEKISEPVLEMLHWSLNEVMDNVLIHSQKPNGWFSIQLFPQSREIRLIICDTGIGIHSALTSGNSHFAGLTEKEAIERCIDIKVTNGRGLGFGLYGTAEFVKQNRGRLQIHSGSFFLDNNQDKFWAFSGSRWPGTYVYLLIKMDNAVNYGTIFKHKHSLKDDYQEHMEKLIGKDQELW